MIEEIVSNFLNRKPDEGSVDPNRWVSFTYKSDKLTYGISIDLVEKYIAASADFNEPFAFACISEVSAEYDQIAIETEPEYYGDDEILVCRKDYENQKNIKTLMIKSGQMVNFHYGYLLLELVHQKMS